MNHVLHSKIRDCLNRQELYHLIPVYDSTHEIPQRINRYSDDLFVVFNPKTQYYEVHSLEHSGYLPSLQCVLPYRNLDARAERFIQRNDIRIHGKEIFRRIERSEELREKRRQREFKNTIRDIASETQSMFAKDAWLFGT